MRLNLIRSAAAAAALGLLPAAGADATVRMNPVHPAPSRLVSPLLGRPHFYATNEIRTASNSCPSSYITCVTITKKSPTTIDWCYGSVTSSGTCDPASGTWTWSATAYNCNTKGKCKKPTTKISVDDFTPNPGDPSDESVSATFSKAASYPVVIEACYSSSNCSTGQFLVTVEKK
jgi:hypothetical protein